MSAVRQVALGLAAMGLHVFPSPSDGAKKGLIKGKRHGAHWGASCDAATVAEAFARFPAANLGVRTGPESGLFVIEGDRADDVDGVRWIEELLDECMEVRPTTRAVTPSGSVHWWWRYPRGWDVRTCAGAMAPGVDVRGWGGMVIAPPSRRDGRPYRWLDKPSRVGIAEAPAELLTLLYERARRIPPSERAARPRPAHEAPPTMGEAQAILDHIDPGALGYDDWLTVVMGINAHTGGGAEGFALADAWSARGDRYEPGEVERRWDDFDPAGGVGWGSVCVLARRFGADLSAIRREHLRRSHPPTPRPHPKERPHA